MHVDPSYPVLRGSWIWHAAALVALVALTCALYAGDVGIGFLNVDDPTYVVENPWIRDVTSENVAAIVTTPYFANYSPVHLLSYMADHAVGGLDPRVFHLSNNLWAGLGAGALYLLTVALVGRRSVAWAASLLFVVHPVHVEAVAWISSRKDLVAAAFAFGAMAAYFLYRRRESRSRAWYAGSLALFGLAVAAKLSVATVPAILLAFDLLVEGRRDRGAVLDKVPFAALVVLFALPTFGSQPETGREQDLFTIGYSLWQNLGLLTGFGEYVMSRPRLDAGSAGAVRLVAWSAPFVFAFVPWTLRRWIGPVAVATVYWALLAMVPPLVLGFVHPVADRYLYFPSAAVTVLLALAGATVARRWRRPGTVAALALFAAVAGGWVWQTVDYLAEWRDPRSVWYGATRKTDDVMVFQYLGGVYQDTADAMQNRLAAGSSDREQMVSMAGAVWRDDPRLDALLEEWRDGAYAGPRSREFRSGLRALAAEQFDLAVARQGGRVVPNLHYRLGMLALAEGDLAGASVAFGRAVDQAALHSSSRVRYEFEVRARYALGLVALRRGDPVDALAWFQAASEAQARSGRTFIPDLDRRVAQLQRRVDRDR